MPASHRAPLLAHQRPSSLLLLTPTTAGGRHRQPEASPSPPRAGGLLLPEPCLVPIVLARSSCRQAARTPPHPLVRLVGPAAAGDPRPGNHGAATWSSMTTPPSPVSGQIHGPRTKSAAARRSLHHQTSFLRQVPAAAPCFPCIEQNCCSLQPLDREAALPGLPKFGPARALLIRSDLAHVPVSLRL